MMEEDTTEEMSTDAPPLTISDGGAVLGEVIGEVGEIAGSIVEDVAAAIDNVADLFAEITDLIGESLLPIYDVSYLSLSIIIYIINE